MFNLLVSPLLLSVLQDILCLNNNDSINANFGTDFLKESNHYIRSRHIHNTPNRPATRHGHDHL